MTTRKPLHERRNVTQAEIIALLGVRELLRRGELRFQEIDGYGYFEDAPRHGHVFNMRIPLKTSACGSIGCIGGNMAMALYLRGLEPRHYVDKGGFTGAMRSLFYPTEAIDWNKIKPRHAVQAIDNWLRTGDPKWKKVMGK